MSVIFLISPMSSECLSLYVLIDLIRVLIQRVPKKCIHTLRKENLTVLPVTL